MTRAFTGAVCLFACIGFAAAGPAHARAGDVDYDAIADRVVNQSLQVQPGEVVAINGGPTEIDLMGALQIAVAKAGGQAILQLNIPEANKRAVMETPMEHLRLLPTAAIMQLRMADAVINVASVQDPTLFADVPEERMAAQREAFSSLNAAFRTARFRSVSLGQTGGIPTEAYAESQGVRYDEMAAMFWKAVGVGSDRLAAIGERVAGQLAPGRKAHITSEAGTDLSFAIDRLPARINAGRTADVIQTSGPAQAWLPAGEAYACVKSDSASGKLVVPHTTFRGVVIDNLEMTFEQGKMTSMSAEEGGEILQKYFDASSDETKALSIVDVGLNSQSQTPAGSRHASWEMEGMVTLTLGNNAWAGGDNAAEGTASFHVGGVTLKVGEEEVVSGGKLAE